MEAECPVHEALGISQPGIEERPGQQEYSTGEKQKL
jgi:hypothetical protein